MTVFSLIENRGKDTCYIFFILICSAFSSPIWCQETNELDAPQWYVETTYQRGSVMPTNRFLAGDNADNKAIDSYEALAIKFGKQTRGKEDWEQLWNFPRLGVGCSIWNFWNKEELGYPIGGFIFFQSPLIRKARFEIYSTSNIGGATNWQYYDAETNPYNSAIGMNFAFYFHTKLNFSYKFNRWEVNGGVGYTHFSNGNMKRPNGGIELFGVNLGVTHHFKEYSLMEKRTIPPFIKTNEVNVSVLAGMRHQSYFQKDGTSSSMYSPIYGIWWGVNRQLSYKIKVGAGVSLYNNSFANIDTTVVADNQIIFEVAEGIEKRTELGVFTSLDFMIHKFSLVIAPEIYIIKQPTLYDHSRVQLNTGFKYYFYDDWYAKILIKGYFKKRPVANFPALFIGYRF